MKPAASFVLLLFGTALPLTAQSRPPVDFQITKITKNLITAPQFAYEGAQQYVPDERERWLEVEVEFAAAPAWTDELTAKYFILLNGKLLTGEVTHVNMPAGRELRSVMYVTPRSVAHFMGDRPLAAITKEKRISPVSVRIGPRKEEPANPPERFAGPLNVPAIQKTGTGSRMTDSWARFNRNFPTVDAPHARPGVTFYGRLGARTGRATTP